MGIFFSFVGKFLLFAKQISWLEDNTTDRMPQRLDFEVSIEQSWMEVKLR